MKNLYLLILIVSFGTLVGQNVPQSVNYQSVIRSNNGAIIPNQSIEIKLSVLKGSLLGTYVYQEIHATTTNSLGLINIKLGGGLSLLSSFDQMNWSQGPFFLRVEIDTSLSGSFISIGESELSSVPFSLYSQRAAISDSLSPAAVTQLPRLTLSGDTLFMGSLDTIPLNLSTYSLTEAEVDSMVSNNGYLTSEVDGSITNEIQDLQLATNTLTITNNSNATSIDLSTYLDNTVLDETQVDNYVSNNGYLTSEVDGSITNEIQDLQLATNTLTITNNSNATSIDLSTYLDNTVLDETQVDNYVSNNGYLTSEVDGSITNEIQDLQLATNTLTITNNSNATSIDLSTYLDNTVLDETQVDNYVSNNGYLTSEVDGSITNEIQDLQDVLTQDNDANNKAIYNVKRQSIGQQTLDTSAVFDISSTTQGLLPPRMTQAQRNAIYSPAAGLIIWCTDCGTNGLFSAYNGNGWTELQLTNPAGTVPIVSTNPNISFGFSSATIGGSVISNGGSSILAKGLCYSTSPNPNITDFTTPTDTGNGIMSYFLNYLDTNTTYYVRAYAQNQNGIGYGTQVSFTTKTTVAIGDTFGGGIVAYILQGNDIGYVSGEQHGIIISPFDFGISSSYGKCQTNYTGYPNLNFNYLAIDSTLSTPAMLAGGVNAYAVLRTCNYPYNIIKLVDNYSLNGYTDWVIPTLHDWQYGIAPNKTAINLSLGSSHQLISRYWSSTIQGNYSRAYTVNIGTSSINYIWVTIGSSSSYNSKVRAVRYF